MAALPAAGDSSAEAFRAVALEGVDADVKLELDRRAAAPATAGDDDSPQTYKLTVSAGPDTEEYEGLSVKKGRTYIVTKVNAASKLIKLEETGGGAARTSRSPPGSYTLVDAEAGERGAHAGACSRATSPSARAWAASRRSTRSRWSSAPT